MRFRWNPARRKFLVGALAFGFTELADKSGINPGTLWGLINGRRATLGYDDRFKLMRSFPEGFEADDAERFLDGEHRRKLEDPVIQLDPSIPAHPLFEPGQRFLICASFTEAIREFELVYQKASEQQDFPLQADAAARIAWAHYEQGFYRESQKWYSDGIKLISTHIGATFGQIMDSIRPGSQSSLCPIKDEASHVLSRLLQIRSKCYIESVVYLGEKDFRRKAMEAIEQCIRLNRHLQLPDALGHDLRWQAVLVISGDYLYQAWAKSLLHESQELLGKDSLGAAYLARDRGIFNWKTGRRPRSMADLDEAVHKLSSYSDSRALGPTFHVLAQVADQSHENSDVIAKYALTGAALHPYGFVLQNALKWLRETSLADKRRFIEDLRSGTGPFKKVVPVLSQLTDGSLSGGRARLDQNLSIVLGRDVLSWLYGDSVRSLA